MVWFTASQFQAGIEFVVPKDNRRLAFTAWAYNQNGIFNPSGCTYTIGGAQYIIDLVGTNATKVITVTKDDIGDLIIEDIAFGFNNVFSCGSALIEILCTDDSE